MQHNTFLILDSSMSHSFQESYDFEGKQSTLQCPIVKLWCSDILSTYDASVYFILLLTIVTSFF
jgi:hypothetical protein